MIRITLFMILAITLNSCSNSIELTNETAKSLIESEFSEYCYETVWTVAADIPSSGYKDARKAIKNFKKLESLGLIKLNKRNGRWGNKVVDDYSWTPTEKGKEYKRERNNSKSYVYYATFKSMAYEITGISINQENKSAKVFFKYVMFNTPFSNIVRKKSGCKEESKEKSATLIYLDTGWKIDKFE